MAHSICLIACWFDIGPTLWCSSAMTGCSNSTRSLPTFAVSGRASPQPPYLRDVAACELAIANLRMRGKAQLPPPVATEPARRFRRNFDAVFLPCTYDIRSIFEGHTSEGHASEAQASETPARRDVMLAILIPPD